MPNYIESKIIWNTKHFYHHQNEYFLSFSLKGIFWHGNENKQLCINNLVTLLLTLSQIFFTFLSVINLETKDDYL